MRDRLQNVFCVFLNDRVIESRALRTMLEADELDSNPVFRALQVTADRRIEKSTLTAFNCSSFNLCSAFMSTRQILRRMLLSVDSQTRTLDRQADSSHS